MKIYVGTLYSIENEFDECKHSIYKQTYKNFSHHVIQNLPNREAHFTLFNSFLERTQEYDLLIKVDADMVLCDENLFSNIVNEMQENTWAKIISIAVYDYFSDQLIWGLNAYRNSVRWNFEKNTLFVDRPEVPSKKILFDDSKLAPAANHCKNPSPYQAFHFGVHRGLKVIQPRLLEKNESSSRSHWRTLEKTYQHFLKNKDIRLGLACLGAEMTYQGKFSPKDIDYTYPDKIMNVIEKYETHEFGKLLNIINKYRFLNFSFIHNERRRKLLRLIYS